MLASAVAVGHIPLNMADLRDAVKNLDAHMKGTLDDYLIESIAETKIMDVYRYVVKDENPKANAEE